MNLNHKDYKDLPTTITADDLRKYLNIGRNTAYEIANEIGIRVGQKRLVIPRHKLIEYLNR